MVTKETAHEHHMENLQQELYILSGILQTMAIIPMLLKEYCHKPPRASTPLSFRIWSLQSALGSWALVLLHR